MAMWHLSCEKNEKGTDPESLVAPCSRKEGLTGECEYPVANAMLADADLSNATVSADLRTQRGQSRSDSTLKGSRSVAREEIWYNYAQSGYGRNAR